MRCNLLKIVFDNDVNVLLLQLKDLFASLYFVLFFSLKFKMLLFSLTAIQIFFLDLFIYCFNSVVYNKTKLHYITKGNIKQHYIYIIKGKMCAVTKGALGLISATLPCLVYPPQEGEKRGLLSRTAAGNRA